LGPPPRGISKEGGSKTRPVKGEGENKGLAAEGGPHERVAYRLRDSGGKGLSMGKSPNWGKLKNANMGLEGV